MIPGRNGLQAKRQESKLEPFPVWWTVKMEKKQNETEDILRYLT